MVDGLWLVSLPMLVGNQDGTIALMAGGAIWDHQKAAEIVDKIQQFYAQFTPDEIANYNAPTLQRSTDAAPGFVYLMKGRDMYKIGRSEDVSRRKKQIEKQWQTNIELIHEFKCKDMAKEESALHTRFWDKRVHGEWFALNLDDIAYIKSIQSI